MASEAAGREPEGPAAAGLLSRRHGARTRALLTWVRLRVVRLARLQGLARRAVSDWTAGLPAAEAEAVAILAAADRGDDPSPDGALGELDDRLAAAEALAWDGEDDHPVLRLGRRFSLTRPELEVLARGRPGGGLRPPAGRAVPRPTPRGDRAAARPRRGTTRGLA